MDLHCHIDLYQNPVKVVDEIYGRETVVFSVTTTPSAFVNTKALADHVPNIYTGIGLHPQLVAQRHNELELALKLMTNADFVGEIGLDGGSEYKGSWQQQNDIFSRTIECAENIGGKILSVHSRRAAAAVLDVFDERLNSCTPILHWFSGSLKQLHIAIEMGCWFSVGPPMLSSAKGQLLVNSIPRNRLLLETDGPFTNNGHHPWYPWEASQICPPLLAEVWGLPVSEVNTQLDYNLSSLLAKMVVR